MARVFFFLLGCYVTKLMSVEAKLICATQANVFSMSSLLTLRYGCDAHVPSAAFSTGQGVEQHIYT